jgi:hypothetical protein
MPRIASAFPADIMNLVSGTRMYNPNAAWLELIMRVAAAPHDMKPDIQYARGEDDTSTDTTCSRRRRPVIEGAIHF